MRTSILTRCGPRGLTLIEVVAGLALMGTLVAAMLTARGRFAEQHRHAHRVLAAAEAMDGLLAEHYTELTTQERPNTGRFVHTDTLRWRTIVIPHRAAESWHCKVVRVEIFDAADTRKTEPLVSVDLLVPAPTSINPTEDQPNINDPADASDKNHPVVPERSTKPGFPPVEHRQLSRGNIR